MGDEDQDKKSSGVPAWQLKSSTTTSDTEEESVAGASTESPSRASVVETARKFLQEDEVRNSTTDKQVEFLESKGLTGEEIQELLGVMRNTDASRPAIEQPARSQIPVASLQKTPSSLLTQQPANSTPPIITYPEFLTTSAAPAPLITASRLLTTLYLFGGLSAVIYGTSTFLVAPMVAMLSSSRHTLAEKTQSNLDKLITQLSGMVSQTPAATTIDRYTDLDTDSDSDPTELFHRDIGVQTSLPATPRPSSPSPTKPLGVVDTHAANILQLKSHVKKLLESSDSEGWDGSDLSTSVLALHNYLDGFIYNAKPTYNYNTYGQKARNPGEEEDVISQIKAEIRSVKGVLLSAKSFPGGVNITSGVSVR